MDVAQQRRLVALGASGVLLLCAVLAGVSIGAVPLAPSGVLSSLLRGVGVQLGTPLPALESTLLLDLRLPRVVLAASGRRHARRSPAPPTRGCSATRSPTRTCSVPRPAPGSGPPW